jgi:EAL domain-containing protein (putative c-di-GMP-specific phosphodiesterase class I)/DNA-binding response OmpR family regulator
MAQPRTDGSPLVLVVDDDPDVRALVGAALRRAGLRTAEAPDGETALRAATADPIAVVVCDLGMPGLSGIDVVRRLRERSETATLPFILMTGSADGEMMYEALEAGADDFLAKPLRLQELVARVRAHARTGTAWRDLIANDLQKRAEAVRAIGQLPTSGQPEDTAETIVAELVRRTNARFVGILQLIGASTLRPLATYTDSEGTILGGPAVDRARTANLLSRAREGPWVVSVGSPDPGEAPTPFWASGVDVAAGAPIYAQDALVGLLTIGTAAGPGTSTANERGRLLGQTIDFANILSASFGPAMAERREIEAERTRLRRFMRRSAMTTVYQPIVVLDGLTTIGYEALTRFADGTPPDVRFGEASAVGLAVEFELAAVAAAIDGARSKPADTFLSVNVAPDVVIAARESLAELLRNADRPVVIEVTEHVEIASYPAFRASLEGMGLIELAVDDAGAGFASLRHILELGPRWVKLDISLVRGIDADPLRQALAAGLVYFGLRANFGLIAEGIETAAEADTLRDIGVDLGQGYLFGRPTAADD